MRLIHYEAHEREMSVRRKWISLSEEVVIDQFMMEMNSSEHDFKVIIVIFKLVSYYWILFLTGGSVDHGKLINMLEQFAIVNRYHGFSLVTAISFVGQLVR